MRRLWVDVFAHLAVATTATASGIVYITDLPAFSALAPCAGSVVSSIVQSLTTSACPVAVTALESCACTKDQNAAALASQISKMVLSSCGTTATEDVTSASKVFNGYCNQGETVTTPPPAGPTVSQYITDLSAYSDLAPCAARALSSGVQYLTSSLCPYAQSALASCACTKNQNSLKVSGWINTMVFESCGKTHTQDVSSAQAVFAGYCGLGAGTTFFPTPSALPGDVTYYITDLPSFSSLARCAATAVSTVVQWYTSTLCPDAPRSLVSCVCVKDQNSQAASSFIASNVRYSCGSTASEDVTSALGIFDYYCSAGQGLVTPQGVTASITRSRNGQQTSSVYSYGPAATSKSASGPNPTPDSSNRLSTVPIGPIIGGAVGGGLFLALLAWTIWMCRRRRHPEPPPMTTEAGARYGYGKPELPATSAAIPASNNPIPRKPISNMGTQYALSPVSPVSDKPAFVGGTAELHSPWAQYPYEISADPNAHEVSGMREAAELHNQHPHSELQGSQHYSPESRGPISELPGHRWEN